MSENLYAGRQSNETLEYLLRRRSVPIKNIAEPGPDAAQIDTILTAAARVPDHGKLCPWYFIVFQGKAREDVGDMLARIYRAENPDKPDVKIDFERERFLRAPLVIGVVSRIREGKHAVWEQILSAGAACQNLCLAANAMGFGTNWITEWYAYNDTFRNELGLDARDHVAGFIYIGTPAGTPAERERPDLREISTVWEKDKPLNKGDCYDRKGMGLPEERFDFSRMRV